MDSRTQLALQTVGIDLTLGYLKGYLQLPLTTKADFVKVDYVTKTIFKENANLAITLFNEKGNPDISVPNNKSCPLSPTPSVKSEENIDVNVNENIPEVVDLAPLPVEVDKTHLDEASKEEKLHKFMNINQFDKYLEQFPTYDSITELNRLRGELKDDIFEELSNVVEFKPNIKTTIFLPKDDTNNLYIVFEDTIAKSRTIYASDMNNWAKDIYKINTTQYPQPNWTDELVNKNQFIRIIGEYKFYIEDGQIKSIEQGINGKH